MTDADLLAAIDEEVTFALACNSESRTERDLALKYFNGELPPPPCQEDLNQGMSSIVSTDVQDAVYAVSAEILPAFSGSSPVEFTPFDEEDEDRASLETRAVNYVAAKNGAYMAIGTAIKDIMLFGGGAIKVVWEERKEVEYATSQGVPFEMLPSVMQAAEGEQIDIVEGELDEENGTAVLTSRRYRKSSKPRMDSIPPEELLVSADAISCNLDKARFVAHLRPVSRTDLVELGIEREVVESLSETSSFSRRLTDKTDPRRSLETGHPSTEFIDVCESYYKVDFDGDGIAELRRVLTAGGSNGTDQLLRNEPWDQQPFCAGVGYLGTYDWTGVSLFDRLRDIQDTKTDLIRDIRNQTKRTMRQTWGLVIGDANADDAQTAQMGGLVQCRTPSGVFQIPSDDMPQQAFPLVQYLDQMRSDKGGGAVDMTSGAQALGQGGDWSLERMMSAVEQLNAYVAKNICETLVKAMWSKLHSLLRQYQQDPITLPGSTGWSDTRPADWPMREDLELATGMSVGERGRRAGALNAVIQQQDADAEKGLNGILYDLDSAYQARVDLAQLAGLPNPQQYYLNPKSDSSQQAQQQQAESQAAQQQMAQQQQQEQMQFQHNLLLGVEQLKADNRQAIAELQEEGKAARAEMDQMLKLFSEKVNLAELEQNADTNEAQLEIDRLQTATSSVVALRGAQ